MSVLKIDSETKTEASKLTLQSSQLSPQFCYRYLISIHRIADRREVTLANIITTVFTA
jgi:hypothetical protein